MKMKPREKQSLGGFWALAYLSGGVLFVFTRWIRVSSVVGEQHHPSESWIRVLHSLTTYLGVLGVGYVIKGHAIPGLKSKTRKGARTGIAVLILMATLILSAVGTLYGGESALGSLCKQGHALLGISLPAVLIFHLVKTRSFKGLMALGS